MKTFDELMAHFLQDMYYAEQQAARFLPQVAAALQSRMAREAVDANLRLTKAHVDALKSVFVALGQDAQGVTCEAILGLLKETEEVLAEAAIAGPIRDAALIACLLAIQHYSVARYGALFAWAKLAGSTKAAEILSTVYADAQASAKLFADLTSGEIAKAAQAVT